MKDALKYLACVEMKDVFPRTPSKEVCEWDRLVDNIASKRARFDAISKALHALPNEHVELFLAEGFGEALSIRATHNARDPHAVRLEVVLPRMICALIPVATNEPLAEKELRDAQSMKLMKEFALQDLRELIDAWCIELHQLENYWREFLERDVDVRSGN
jgi:hypothetical protein